MTVYQRRGPRLLVRNASEIAVPQAEGRRVDRLPKHALYIEAGKVRWLGLDAAIPQSYADAPVYDAEGCAVLPAMVDAHTHLVFGGDRIADFDRRSRGLSYAQIAAEGGGIHTSVEATRAASFSELLDATRGRLQRRLEAGIGTTEMKSGYGLNREHELRQLEVAAALKGEGFDIEATLLAAHVIPKDKDRSVWVQEIIEQLIPEVAERGLARFVDAFVEQGAYTVQEAHDIFLAAKQHGLLPRVHADQLTDGAGAALAARVQASSADHLEYISDEGIAALKRGKVVAMLLPGAMTYLGDSAPHLGRRLVDAGVTVAVATDANPGSSPTNNLPLMATLAVTQMGLSADEALRAITLGAAQALRRPDLGTLTAGARGRFIVVQSPDARALVASFGEPIVKAHVDCVG